MKRTLSINQTTYDIAVEELKSPRVRFAWAGKQFEFELLQRSAEGVVLKDAAGVLYRLQSTTVGALQFISGAGLDAEISEGASTLKKKAGVAGSLAAPMPGKVFKVLSKVGDKVKQGQTLLILEAMKMEHPIKADKDGTVAKLLFSEGDLVQGGMPLAELE
ncbi:MAG: biotin/lipoyl-containing protein [Bacteriovoracia bacterium]